MAKGPISGQMMRDYQRDGFVLARGMFDREEFDLLRRAAKQGRQLDQHALGRGDGEGGTVRQSAMVHDLLLQRGAEQSKESHHPRYTPLVKVPNSAIRDAGLRRFSDSQADVAWQNRLDDRRGRAPASRRITTKAAASKTPTVCNPRSAGRNTRRLSTGLVLTSPPSHIKTGFVIDLPGA